MASGAASPTRAMRDIYEQEQESFAACVAALPYPAGAAGVIAAINGRFVALDLFDNLETLESIWPRLITGYAMDALAARRGKPAARQKAFSANGATALLDRLGQIPCDLCPTVGLGKDWRLEAPDLVGQALVAKATCIHLSAFPSEDQGRQQQAGPGPRILPPSQRRCGRGRQTPE